ncbi:MAG: signal recognition particle-docking protein FtsY [Candidatus Aenigmatarchaeota archaeon]
MFGFLKKKLKEGIEKISNIVSEKEEKKIEEVVEEIKKEEHATEPKKELIKEVEKEIEPLKKEIIEEAEEIVKEIAEEKIQESKKIIETAKEIEKIDKTKKAEKTKRELIEALKEKPEKKGIVEKIKKKISEKKIEEKDIKDILKELEISLISSDVAVEVAEKICNDLKNNLVGKFIKKSEIEKTIKDSLKNSIFEILNIESFDLIEKIKTKKPFLIVFLGFNGSGKSTTIARIGYLLKKNKISCVFAAGDSWRAAAIEQLEEHGKKLGIEVIKHKYGADPAAVIFDAVKHAKAKDIDVVLADTAGRSHTNVNLIDELKKIVRVNKPDLKILVLDALTGNDIYEQCKMFNNAVGVDALIVTKADVYEKGGAMLSASYTIKKPILYIGIGQSYEDLEKFSPEKIVKSLLD